MPTDVPTIAENGHGGHGSTRDLRAGVNALGDALRLVGAVRVLGRWSSGDAVLVQKAAELINAQDSCRAVELLL